MLNDKIDYNAKCLSQTYTLIFVNIFFVQETIGHADMASSLVSKAKKAKDHVEEGLEKVRAKPWATPLGKALQVREASHCTKRDVDTI